MKRTTIVAEERTLYRLQRLADARDISLSQVIREALEEKVAREQPPLTFIGRGRARPPDAHAPRAADETDAYRAEDYRG